MERSSRRTRSSGSPGPKVFVRPRITGSRLRFTKLVSVKVDPAGCGVQLGLLRLRPRRPQKQDNLAFQNEKNVRLVGSLQEWHQSGVVSVVSGIGGNAVVVASWNDERVANIKPLVVQYMFYNF